MANEFVVKNGAITPNVQLTGSTSGSTTVVASATASGTLTLPAATDTLVGKATTDTLTNKTINLSNNTLTATSAQILAAVSDETGSGSLVFATSPTLVTPVLGVASATSINKVAITAPATGSTLTIADGKTLTASNSLTFTGTDATSFAFPGTSDTVVTLTATQTLTNKTLTSPTLTTPSLGVATATSINKVAITAPATSATLTIADGKTLTASNTLTFTGTDASSVAFGTGGTVAYTANKLSAFAATTSAELAGVISDETGTGSLVFSASPTFTGTANFAAISTSGAATVGGNLTVTGDLTVNGTTTTINSTVVSVDDITFELGSVATPTDVTANGGGIVLKGATDKSITWSSIGWTSSEDFNLLTGKQFEINGTAVLSATTLGSGVTASSLTSVGTIGTGTWQGSVINSTYGGTGVNNGGRTITLNTGNLTIAAQAAGSSVTIPASGTLVSSADTGTVTSTMILDGTIVNADINASAAIALTKLASDTTTALGVGTLELGHASDTTLSRSSAGVLAVEGVVVPTISSTNTLTNKSLSDSTTFFIDDLDGTKKMQFQLSGITTATTRTLTVPDVSGTIVTTGDTGTVTSTMILDGTIVNADINASAAIAVSKLAASTISGVTLGSNLNSLTAGTGLSGTAYNGSANQTWTLATSGVTAASYGSASAVPVITVDTYGRITSASSATITKNVIVGTRTTPVTVATTGGNLTVGGRSANVTVALSL